MINNNLKWGVVIVAYNPEIRVFKKKIDAISKLTDGVVVINNGSKLSFDNDRIELVNLDSNKGIAYAQNLGADILREKQKEFFFFFDQDSEFSQSYFLDMINEWLLISKDDTSLGALSPNVIDKNFNYAQPILYFSNNKIVKHTLNKNKVERIKNTLPISSGILISDKAYKDVKGAKADYFIDFVDFELDLNLMKHGYTIYSTSKTQIMHAIGKKDERIFFSKKIYPTNHPIFRDYYFMRNGCLTFRLYGKKYKGIRKLIIRSFMIRYIFVIYEKEKLKRIHYLSKGILDGMLGKNYG